MIRAFIAIELDRAVLRRVASAVDTLRGKISAIRWTAEDSCHLTLKFLGNINEEQVNPISDALQRELDLFPRFSINAKGLGVFPDAKRARVLWVGIEGKSLPPLAKIVEDALVPLHFEPERRVFVPHVTVGRWRQFGRAQETLSDVLREWQEREFGGFSVNEVVLFQSLLSAKGAEYRRLKIMHLSNTAALA